ncbi:unnamed protein product [Effrenium voratum]|uniref:Uncharacterized protein n=1 Tax=Effrenium voratum TaxID=2562239 RepID=A0AA36IQQ5_9DINO|nr:unnamed protein product [Effrenium voratum]
MPLPKNVYQALKDGSGTAGISVRQVSNSSSDERSASHENPASARHGERLKRFLAVVEQRSEDFELYISNLRLEMLRKPKMPSKPCLSSQTGPDVPFAQPCLLMSSRAEPDVPLAKPCLLISSKQSQNAVVSL